MTGHRETLLPVQLWPRTSEHPDVTALTASFGGKVVADLFVTRAPATVRVTVVSPVGPVADGSELAALVDAVIDLGRASGRPKLVLAAGPNLRLRHFARAAGFTGPLRADLALDRSAVQAAPAGPSPSARDRLLGTLGSLLPGVAIDTVGHRGALRSLLPNASTGVAGTVDLAARGPGDLEPLRVSFPVTDGVMLEGVALAIDTALSVRRRFRPLVDLVRLFFDHKMEGMRAGKVAGVADASVRDVHLNRAYVSVTELEMLERQQEQRSSSSSFQPRHPPRTEQAPFSRLDSVVAHEFWHQIEFGLESGRYRDSVEFRRAVGRYFGVETLEHAIKGARPDAAPQWQAARVRLAEEVSGYAATAPKEATAEMFAQWWCTTSAPPPSAQFFGQLLRQLFPAAHIDR